MTEQVDVLAVDGDTSLRLMTRFGSYGFASVTAVAVEARRRRKSLRTNMAKSREALRKLHGRHANRGVCRQNAGIYRSFARMDVAFLRAAALARVKGGAA